MKRKIILFLLNLIGGNKNQETEEEKGARRTGCGCLMAVAFAPFLPILLFIIMGRLKLRQWIRLDRHMTLYYVIIRYT